MSNRISFLGLGIFFTISSIALIVISNTGSDPNFNFIFLPSLSLAILSFTMWFVQPELKYNDERTKYIKQKTLSSTTFGISFYIIVIVILVNFTSITLKLEEILNVLLGLIVMTISLLLITYTKKN